MSLNRFKYLRLLLLISILHVIYRSNARTSDGIIISESNLQGLQAFKQSLEDPKGFLKSWNDTGIGACLGTWYGIKCVKGQVIAIQLPWRGLGGKITEKIGQLSGLRKLSLHDNFIGGQIPASVGFLQNLKGLILFNNRFSGNIPPSIGNCLFLQTLDLSNNSLIGSIPPSISTSSKLYRVNLSYNSLSGSIPTGLTQSPSLTFLSLQNNDLSGSVSDTWGDETITYQLQILNLDNNSFIGNVPSTFSRLPLLQEITLSNNKFSGRIPEEIGSLPKIQKLDFSNNSITGDFPSSFPNLSSLLELRLDNNHISNSIPESIDGMQKLAIFSVKHNNLSGEIPATLGNITTLYHLDLSDNALSGEIPSSIEKLSNLTFFNVSNNKLSGQVPFSLSQKFKPSSFSGNIQLCGYSPSTPCPTPPPSASPSSAVAQKTKKLSTRDIILIVSGAILATLLLLCCILLCCLIRKRVKSKQQSKSTGAGPATTGRAEKPGPAAGPEVESGGEAGGKLVHFDGPFVFTADDLLCATAEIMGKSTYGTVYKATLEDGNEVAVKRLREKIAKGQKEFEAEVNIIGKIRHENLLALRAYYLGPKGEKLLVFDYMPKGSLAAFLHARGPDSPINWATRMKIIKGTTKGLNYLHNEVNMIHGNLTSSNILLDGEMNAKISDHGLSRLMTGAANAAVVTAAGALGYRAPELVKVKKAGVKTDVYSLGVVMLELLTGKSPAEEMGGMDLPQWVASIVKEEWTNEVFDLELMREVEGSVGDELLNTLKLALHCVDPTPGARPDVAQVMVQLEEIRPEVGGVASTSGSVADPSSSMGEADDV